MKYEYIAVENIYYANPNENPIVNYGIALTYIIGNEQIILKTIPDVSSDRKAIEKLIILCNEESLSPCHLDDVVDDFLLQI